jgi:hypothetical protein
MEPENKISNYNKKNRVQAPILGKVGICLYIVDAL